MMYKDLLEAVKSPTYMNSRTIQTPYLALLAVLELHKPGAYEYFEKDICEHCTLDIDLYVFFPCPTIEAIAKDLLWNYTMARWLPIILLVYMFMTGAIQSDTNGR